MSEKQKHLSRIISYSFERECFRISRDGNEYFVPVDSDQLSRLQISRFWLGHFLRLRRRLYHHQRMKRLLEEISPLIL